MVGVNSVEDWGGEKEGQSKKEGLIGYVNWEVGVAWVATGQPCALSPQCKASLLFWPTTKVKPASATRRSWGCPGITTLVSVPSLTAPASSHHILALAANTALCEHKYTLCPESRSSASSSGLAWLSQVILVVSTGPVSKFHPTFWAAVECDSSCFSCTQNLLPACQWIGTISETFIVIELLFRRQTDMFQSTPSWGVKNCTLGRRPWLGQLSKLRSSLRFHWCRLNLWRLEEEKPFQLIQSPQREALR